MGKSKSYEKKGSYQKKASKHHTPAAIEETRRRVQGLHKQSSLKPVEHSTEAFMDMESYIRPQERDNVKEKTGKVEEQGPSVEKSWLTTFRSVSFPNNREAKIIATRFFFFFLLMGQFERARARQYASSKPRNHYHDLVPLNSSYPIAMGQREFSKPLALSMVHQNTPITLSHKSPVRAQSSVPMLPQELKVSPTKTFEQIIRSISSGETQEHDIDIHQRDKDGNTLLHVAVELGDEEAVKFLLARGLSPHIKNHEGQSSFYPALLQKQWEIIKAFAVAGYDLDEKMTFPDGNVLTLFEISCAVGNMKGANRLVDYGIRIPLEITITADMRNHISKGTYKTLELLHGQVNHQQTHYAEEKSRLIKKIMHLGTGERIKAKNLSIVTLYGSENFKKKYVEIYENHKEEFAKAFPVDENAIFAVGFPNDGFVFIKKFDNVISLLNIRDIVSYEVLLAIYQNDLPRVIYLHEMNDVDKDYLSTLDVLIQITKNQNLELLEYLLKLGYSLHALNINRVTPLFEQAIAGSGAAVSMLLGYGADPNFKNPEGRTALHGAAMTNNLDVLDALMASPSIDPYLKDNQGNTPATLGGKKFTDKLNTLLTKKGLAPLSEKQEKNGYSLLKFRWVNGQTLDGIIDFSDHTVNRITDHGRTVLHIAAVGDRPDLIYRLLELGEDMYIRDSFGKTPFDYACEAGNLRVVKLFLDWGYDVDAAQRNGKTAFFVSLEREDYYLLKMLLNHQKPMDTLIYSGDHSGGISYRVPNVGKAVTISDSRIKKLLQKSGYINSDVDNKREKGIYESFTIYSVLHFVAAFFILRIAFKLIWDFVTSIFSRDENAKENNEPRENSEKTKPYQLPTEEELLEQEYEKLCEKTLSSLSSLNTLSTELNKKLATVEEQIIYLESDDIKKSFKALVNQVNALKEPLTQDFFNEKEQEGYSVKAAKRFNSQLILPAFEEGITEAKNKFADIQTKINLALKNPENSIRALNEKFELLKENKNAKAIENLTFFINELGGRIESYQVFLKDLDVFSRTVGNKDNNPFTDLEKSMEKKRDDLKLALKKLEEMPKGKGKQKPVQPQEGKPQSSKKIQTSEEKDQAKQRFQEEKARRAQERRDAERERQAKKERARLEKERKEAAEKERLNLQQEKIHYLDALMDDIDLLGNILNGDVLQQAYKEIPGDKKPNFDILKVYGACYYIMRIFHQLSDMRKVKFLKNYLSESSCDPITVRHSLMHHFYDLFTIALTEKNPSGDVLDNFTRSVKKKKLLEVGMELINHIRPILVDLRDDKKINTFDLPSSVTEFLTDFKNSYEEKEEILALEYIRRDMVDFPALLPLLYKKTAGQPRAIQGPLKGMLYMMGQGIKDVNENRRLKEEKKEHEKRIPIIIPKNLQIYVSIRDTIGHYFENEKKIKDEISIAQLIESLEFGRLESLKNFLHTSPDSSKTNNSQPEEKGMQPLDPKKEAMRKAAEKEEEFIPPPLPEASSQMFLAPPSRNTLGQDPRFSDPHQPSTSSGISYGRRPYGGHS